MQRDNIVGVTPADLPRLATDRHWRCRKCSYIIERLDTPRCPECGLAFDPQDPTTFTEKMPFVGWSFWLPCALLMIAGGVPLFALGSSAFDYAVGAILAIAFALGGFIGYSSNASAPGTILLGWIAAILCIAIFFAMLTSAWGCFVGSIALLPILLGGLCGWILRLSLKKWFGFTQKEYLA